MTRGGFRGRLAPGGAFGGVSKACVGDQGCGICIRVAIEQGEVETGCFASESQIHACQWLR